MDDRKSEGDSSERGGDGKWERGQERDGKQSCGTMY